MSKPKKVIIAIPVEETLFRMIKERAAEADRPLANYVRNILKMVHQEEVEAE
jgi:hypothetical protein